MQPVFILSFDNVYSVADDNYFSDFPVNIWVVSFIVYAFCDFLWVNNSLTRYIYVVYIK